MESRLVLSRGGLPPLSARGCQQTLTPIQLGAFDRTTNGDLVYLEPSKKTKYKSQVLCEDKTVFASEGLWPGQELTVSCIQRLCQKATGGKTVLERTPVDRSVRVVDSEAKSIKILMLEDRELTYDSAAPVFISYNPILNMRVTDFRLKTEEWGLKSFWELELEEV